MFHSQSVHKLDPKPYKCRICYKSFSNSSYLSQHNRIHLGIKPFKCRVCERKFTQHCHLMQHMRYVCLFRLIYACLEFATVLPWKCSEESLNRMLCIRLWFEQSYPDKLSGGPLPLRPLCRRNFRQVHFSFKFYNISIVQHYRLESY